MNISMRTILVTTISLPAYSHLGSMPLEPVSMEEVEKLDHNTEYKCEISIKGSLRSLIELLDNKAGSKIELQSTKPYTQINFYRLTNGGLLISWIWDVKSNLKYYSVIEPENIPKFKKMVKNQERIRDLFSEMSHIKWK